MDDLRRLAALDLARVELELRAAQAAMRRDMESNANRVRYAQALERHGAAERWGLEVLAAPTTCGGQQRF